MRRRLLAILVLGLLAALVPFGTPSSADHAWADADAARIHPGVQVVSPSGQCTANFVFSDGVDVFLGLAAHCTGLGGATSVDGCTTGSLPVGTAMQIRGTGGTFSGTLAYSSWATMQRVSERNTNVCRYNDFSLVKLARSDHDEVNPSVPAFGGPIGLATNVAPYSDTYSSGNSGLRFGLRAARQKYGVHLYEVGDGWSHLIYTLTPGIPGDSGSGVVDDRGRAYGVLSTVAIAPLTGSNNASDLAEALDYANRHGGLSRTVRLVPGTEPFRSVAVDA